MRTRAAALATAGIVSLIATVAAPARITEIRIDAVEPFAEHQPFGEAGAYERVRGIAKGELDPKAAENRVIVDLDKAPVNARGMVEYETDFFLLRPADGRKAAGMLLYE